MYLVQTLVDLIILFGECFGASKRVVALLRCLQMMFSLIQKIFQTNCFHKYSPGQIQILFLSISLITVGLELSRSEHVYIPALLDETYSTDHLDMYL